MISIYKYFKKFIFNNQIDKSETLNKIILSSHDEISYEKIVSLLDSEILIKVFYPKEDAFICLEDSITILNFVKKKK